MIVLRDKPGSFVTVNKYHEKTHYEVLYLCVVFVDNKKNTEHQTVHVGDPSSSTTFMFKFLLEQQ